MPSHPTTAVTSARPVLKVAAAGAGGTAATVLIAFAAGYIRKPGASS